MIPAPRDCSTSVDSRHAEVFVTVVVPTLNEEESLAATLRSIGEGHRGVEVIVCDAGSTDRTREIAAGHGARVIVSPVRQRAAQLDLAFRDACGEVLLFLHADTLLPEGWLAELRRVLGGGPEIVGGAFRRRFDHPSLWLKATCLLADWRGKLTGVFLGDQAMFIRTSVFRSLGGFRPLDQCEDLDLSRRMSRVGPTAMIGIPVVSSGRRFLRRGPFVQSWRDLATACRFVVGGPSATGSGGPVREPLPAGKWMLRLVLVVALLAGIGLLPVRELMEQALSWVEGFGAWGPALFVAIYVAATVLFIPGSVLTLGAGAVFGVGMGSVLVSIASTLGATCSFLLGRHLARDAISRRIAGNRTFAAIDQAVANEGWKIVGLARLSPVFPFSLLNYAFGLTRVSLRDYVLASWIGMMPGTVMYVYLGSLAQAAAGERSRSAAEWALYAVGLVATVAVTVFVTRLARRALDRRLAT